MKRFQFVVTLLVSHALVSLISMAAYKGYIDNNKPVAKIEQMISPSDVKNLQVEHRKLQARVEELVKAHNAVAKETVIIKQIIESQFNTSPPSSNLPKKEEDDTL